MGAHSNKKVAIIGAGLAGLSAAYHLREKASVTIFERETRIGGRIFTSQQPPGEHGAEFLLESENKLQDLVSKLGVRLTPRITSWPGYLFKNKLAYGIPDEAAKELLSADPVNRLGRLFSQVRRERWPKTTMRLDQWLSSFLGNDKEAIRFVRMLLTGETCAPLHHLSTQYGLECLSSLFNDEWYRVEGGTAVITKELFRRSKARFRTSANVIRVEQVRGGVKVRWAEEGERKSEDFHAAIITMPKGERLVGKPVRGHFHGYVSILLAYREQPRVEDNPGFDLGNGLYTDGPLNYMQLTTCSRPPYVLRILIPNTGAMLHWKAPAIVSFCCQQLEPILASREKPYTSSVKTWKFALPCGGSNRSFQKVGSRVYLAGDRFGKWPSMNAAVASGDSSARDVASLFSKSKI